MGVTTRKTPFRKAFQLIGGGMTLGRAGFEGKCGGVVSPARTPIDDLVVREIRHAFLLLDRHCLYVAVMPNKGPIFLGVYLPFGFEPIGNTLSLAVLIARCEIVKNVVVRAEMSVDSLAFVVFALPRTSDITSIYVAEIEGKLAARQR